MTPDELNQLEDLVALGEKASEWLVDVDRAAGNILFLDTRHMAYVGENYDGNPIYHVAGGQEPLADGDVAYLLAAANARKALATLLREHAAMRAALERIAELNKVCGVEPSTNGHSSAHVAAWDAETIARAALAKETK